MNDESSLLETLNSVASKFLPSLIKIPFEFKFFANSISVNRSPITKEVCQIIILVQVRAVSKPVRGFSC